MEHCAPSARTSANRTAFVTGATGYVGSTLITYLLQRGWQVRALMRNAEDARDHPWAQKVTIVEGDATSYEDVVRALQSTDVAYYLLHSMSRGEDFEEAEAKMAQTFAQAVRRVGTARIVFLGALHPSGKDLSPHLRSRKRVGEILASSGALTAHLQAGMVLGDGSASYAMLRHLAERLPAVVAPDWVLNRITPISARNLIRFLEAAGRVEFPRSRTFDIGGPEDVAYADLIVRYAKVFRLGPRPVMVAPIVSHRVAAEAIGAITPVDTHMAVHLVESLENDTVVSERDLEELIAKTDGAPVQLDTIEQAFAASAADIDARRWWRVAGGVSAAVLVAAGVALAGTEVNSRWYRHLPKPAFQPPGWVFPVAWNVIYPLLAATTSLTIADLGDDETGADNPPQRQAYTAWLGANLALNAAWPWVFYRRRALVGATMVSAGMTVTAAELVRRTAKENPWRAGALALYPAWGGLATAINGWIAAKRA